MPKRAFLPITPELLREFLKLPEGVTLAEHARFDYFNKTIELCVIGDDLPAGDLAIPIYDIVDGVAQFVGWKGREIGTPDKPGTH